MRTHDATFYVQIEPVWSPWRKNTHGDKDLESIKAVAITQTRPKSQRPGTVLTKLTVRVPEAAFLPLRPEAIVVIPEDMLAASLPIEVAAGDPS
jgi:hypothetical protein